MSEPPGEPEVTLQVLLAGPLPRHKPQGHRRPARLQEASGNWARITEGGPWALGFWHGHSAEHRVNRPICSLVLGSRPRGRDAAPQRPPGPCCVCSAGERLPVLRSCPSLEPQPTQLPASSPGPDWPDFVVVRQWNLQGPSASNARARPHQQPSPSRAAVLEENVLPALVALLGANCGALVNGNSLALRRGLSLFFNRNKKHAECFLAKRDLFSRTRQWHGSSPSSAKVCCWRGPGVEV